MAVIALMAITFSAFTPVQKTTGFNYKLPSTGDVLYPTIAGDCGQPGPYICVKPVPERNNEEMEIFHDNGVNYTKQ